MDWTLAIDRNRDAVLRMLNMVFAAAGLARDGSVPALPRHLCVLILRILRPAESALRRLIVVVEFVLEIKARPAPPRVYAGPVAPAGEGSGARVPAFALFDTRINFGASAFPRFTRGNPRVWMEGMDYPVFVTKTVPLPDDLMSAGRLFRRMLALQNALDDLPKQARRMARWKAKRALEQAETGKFIAPMRPGRPPGWRKRGTHPVDGLLSDCHALALYVLHPPDT